MVIPTVALVVVVPTVVLAMVVPTVVLAVVVILTVELPGNFCHNSYSYNAKLVHT